MWVQRSFGETRKIHLFWWVQAIPLGRYIIMGCKDTPQTRSLRQIHQRGIVVILSPILLTAPAAKAWCAKPEKLPNAIFPTLPSNFCREMTMISKNFCSCKIFMDLEEFKQPWRGLPNAILPPLPSNCHSSKLEA